MGKLGPDRSSMRVISPILLGFFIALKKISVGDAFPKAGRVYSKMVSLES